MGPETPLRATLLEAVERAFGTPEALLASAALPTKLEAAWRYSLGLLPRPGWSREALEGAILEAWRRVLLRLPRPLLLVLKDLHHPDPTLERLLREDFPHLLLLVESRRPLFAPHLALRGPKPPCSSPCSPPWTPSRPGSARPSWPGGCWGRCRRSS